MELFLIVVEIVFFMLRQSTFWSYWGTYILGKAFGLTVSIRMVFDFVVTRQSRAPVVENHINLYENDRLSS